MEVKGFLILFVLYVSMYIFPQFVTFCPHLPHKVSELLSD